jgi:hypothetical protein
MKTTRITGRWLLKAFLIICGAVMLLTVVVSWATLATGDSSHKRHQPALAAIRSTAPVPKQSEVSTRVWHSSPEPTPFRGDKAGFPVVSKADYDAIQTGMSYSTVSGMIGSPGEETARSGLAGYSTIVYVWKNPNGSNMNAMFQNDHLVTKAQFELP